MDGKKRSSPLRRWLWTLAIVLWGLLLTTYGWKPAMKLKQPPETIDAKLVKALKRHVIYLSQTIGARHARAPEKLNQAAAYVETELKRSGLFVESQAYPVQKMQARNIIATKRGISPELPMIVIGAHYDSCEADFKEGTISCHTPGADDNASGVAALIELAKKLGNASLSRTVKFIAFTNEEPPFFRTELMGSRIYAKEAKRRGDRIELMLALDMLGFYTDRFGSQRYPPFMGIGRPNAGNFLGIISKPKTGSLLNSIKRAFAQASGLPVEVASVPQWIPGVTFSDHWSFWKEGFPAVLATDTAFLRSPHYHGKTDTWETLDYSRLAMAFNGLESVIQALAQDQKENK